MEKISLQKIKWIKSLQLKKNREKEGLIIVEGAKLVLELIEQYPDLLHSLYTTITPTETKLLSLNGFLCSTNEMERITQFHSAPTMIGVFKEPTWKEFNVHERILVLESIQDPGNLGTIIRTADWFGLDQIVVSADTANCYNPKVVQSTMGSILRVDVVVADLPELFQSAKMPIYGAVLEGKSIQTTELAKEGLLIIGNESKGIRENLMPFISDPISIPRIGEAESLNAAVAAGIILSHFKS